ncbi:exonuclease [Streptomyces phage Bogota]|jgi:hypothetical protein|nr:exonuclease [Streptomyces phage Intolerant]WIC89201.1 exonuclease [Streptomyces phage Bogota]
MTIPDAPREGGRPVSYSELDTFRQCPLKWQLGYREGWKPDREKEAFRLGHVWHEIMERHYLTIMEWQQEAHGGEKRSPARGSFGEEELLELCAGEVGAVMDDLDDDTRALMEWAYAGYVEAYGCDPDWRIIATEQKGEVPLAPGGRPLVWVIDLVVEDLSYGGVWIVDHKFPGDLASDVEIDLDDQLGLYWFAWGVSGHELAARVNGAMLNESRKKQNKGDLPGAIAEWERVKAAGGKPGVKPKAQTLEQRFRRTRTSRTAEELTTIAEDALQVVRAMETGIIYSSPNPKQCSWKCDFREQHILARSSGLALPEILEDFGFRSRAMREAEAE